MTPQREEELKKLLASADFKMENYDNLSMQDLIILKNSAVGVYSAQMPGSQTDEKKKNAVMFFQKREEFFQHMIMRKLQKSETMFAMLSKSTSQPYICCDPETLNDQIWMFSEENIAKAAAVKDPELQNDLGILKIENKDFLSFYMNLYLMGVNEIQIDRGMNATTVDLTKLINKPNYENIEPAKRPVLNPELVLTGTYFMQELRKPNEKKNKETLADLEEEMLVNLQRGRVIVPVQLPERKEGDPAPKPQDIRIAYMKMPNGDIYQPVCTDMSEFQRFAKDKKFQGITVNYEKMVQVLTPNTKGIILNPTTLKIAIPKGKLTQ